MEITSWHYIGFIIGVLIFVALDLFVFHRNATVISFKEALIWSGVCFVLAMLFGAALWPTRGKEEAMEFITGYIIELSLSMDNVFVIALIFAYFQVPPAYQHRILFIGFINALIMRGVIIWAGTALVARFHWILYFLGALLLYSGLKMMFSKDEGVHPEKNPIIKLAQRIFPITSNYEGAHFFSRINGKFALTPLALVLMMTETTDLIFAIDSIPAILAITTKPFIVFTSNIFAILGLRSLYFVLAGAIDYFKFLKIGLSLVLVFIGAKMLLEKWIHLSTTLSLVIVAGIIIISMLASVFLAKHEPELKKTPDVPVPPEVKK